MKAFIVICMFTSVLAVLPDGYVPSSTGDLAYKLVYVAQPWADAKRLCEAEGAKLAVPKSHEQFADIQKIVRAMSYPRLVGADHRLVVWLGVNNLDDHRTWRNIDGEDINDTGFHQWASDGNGATFSPDPREPHCAGVDAVNPGLRDWWCRYRLAYICQIQNK